VLLGFFNEGSCRQHRIIVTNSRVLSWITNSDCIEFSRIYMHLCLYRFDFRNKGVESSVTCIYKIISRPWK